MTGQSTTFDNNSGAVRHYANTRGVRSVQSECPKCLPLGAAPMTPNVRWKARAWGATGARRCTLVETSVASRGERSKLGPSR
jgi:hypothetical protein